MKRGLMMFFIILTCIFSYCTVYGLTPPPHVEGVISLPDGMVAPAGGISLKVTLQSEKNSTSEEIVISEGENSVFYSILNLNVGGEYIVKCELLTPIEGINDVSYYTGENNEPFEQFAEKLYQPNNYLDVNIKFVEINKVKGTLLIPDDYNGFTKVLKFKIFAFDKNSDDSNSTSNYAECNIEPGERSASFEIIVPKSIDEVVLYCRYLDNPKNDIPVFFDGYLGSDKIEIDERDAIIINPGQPNSQNIEIKPIRAKFGDLNADGSVNVLDFACLRAVLLGKGAKISNAFVADLNGDGVVNVLDFALLRKYLLGLIDKLPA